MNISEIENNIKLTIPTFLCDKALGDIPQPFPSQNFFMVFSAPPRSGKTSLSISLLTTKNNKKSGKKSIYRNVFDNIIVVMPKNSMKSLKTNPFENLDDDKVYHDLDYETLENIYGQILDYASEDEQTLLFLDDVATSLKDNEILKFLNTMVCNRRHLKLSIMLLTQYLNSIPLLLRKNISHLSLFKLGNKKEYKSVYEELIPSDKTQFEQIVKYAFQKPHDNLFLDILNNKYYRNFNLLKFDED